MADKEFLSPVTLAVLKLKNAANTFTNLFSNATTAARTWTLPDKSGTVALSSDLTDLAQLLNPVGTIREFNVSTNPNTLLGFGTWTLHGVGRVTVCIDTGQTEFDTLGETGGSKTHTLATNEIPAHTHTFSGTTSSDGSHIHGYFGGDGQRNADNGTDWNKQGINLGDGKTGNTTASAGAHTHTVSGTTSSTGGGQAHNNLQPYIVVYRWVRTA